MGRRPESIEAGATRATVVRGPRADGRWYWRARTKGTAQECLWTGWATRDEAARRLAELVARGELLRSGHESPESAVVVSDLLRQWADEQDRRVAVGQIGALTARAYRARCEVLSGAIGDVRLAMLTRARVSDVVLRWLAAGMSPRTADRIVVVLSSALRWGHERGAPRPPDLARLVRVDPDQHRYCATTPTREHVRRLLEAMRPGRGRDLVEVLSLTGARVGEIAACRVIDYDRERAELVLHGADADRGARGKVRPRRWPVTPELAVALDRLTAGREPGERLLHFPGEGDASHEARRVLANAAKATGLPRYTAHGLRRMVATELSSLDAKRAADLLGHSPAVMLSTYVRPTSDDLREAVARLVAPRGLVLHLRRGGGE